MLRTKGVAAARSETPSVDVVVAVARQEGVAPHELQPPLADVLDPDALDALIAHADPHEDLTVELTYCGLDVEVNADGSVTVSA